MDLIFDSLEITNFKSFAGGPHVLRFGEYDYGICMLRGSNFTQPTLESNGAGKSSVWDALCWCLTGRTPQGLKNPDIKPWTGSKKTSVTLSVMRDENAHTITRTASPNAVLIDGEVSSQEFIERLTRLNFEVLTNTILLAQNSDLFFDLRPADKMALFTDALQLEVWDARSAAASEKVKMLEAKLRRAEEAKLVRETQIKESQEIYDTLSEKSRSYEADKVARLEDLDVEYKALAKKLDASMIKKGAAEVEADKHGLCERQLREEFEDAYKVLFGVRDESTKAEERRSSLLRDIKRLSADIKDLEDADVCPTCEQSLKGTSLKKHIDGVKKKIKRKHAAIKLLGIAKINKRYAQKEKRVEEIRPGLDACEAAFKEQQGIARVHAENAADLKVSMRTNQNETARLTDEDNPFRDQLGKYRKIISAHKTEVKEAEAFIASFQRRIERNKYWVKGFKDVRLFILTEVLTELEIATNAMLESVGLVGWQVEFEIEVDTKSGTTKRGLQVLIHSPLYESAVRWESWSGGEQQRLRLIGALSLAQVLLSHAGVNPDIEILDEPTRGLSSKGVADLCDFLRERGRDIERQIWYTDHHSVESALFEAVVTVTHDAGGSKIDG